jgi:uncharacterized protein YjbI with pentapeptide repeats
LGAGGPPGNLIHGNRLTSKTFNVIFIVVSVAVSAIGSVVSVAFAISLTVIGAVLSAVVAAMACDFVLACTAAVVGTVLGASAAFFVGSAIRVGVDLNGWFEYLFADLSAFVGVLVGFLFSLFVAWQVRRDEKKYVVTRRFSLALGAIGGSSFRGADLTEADFTGALLKNTNFAAFQQQPTILTRTCFRDAVQLDRAEPGDTILASFKLLPLLTGAKFTNQDLTAANLRGANLNGAQLNGATLKGADLSEASLRQADLQNTNLSETQLVGADLSRAFLTGACIRDWNISQAIFSGTECRFYFLLETPNSLGSRQRHPHNPDDIYNLSEFKKILDEAQIIDIGSHPDG